MIQLNNLSISKQAKDRAKQKLCACGVAAMAMITDRNVPVVGCRCAFKLRAHPVQYAHRLASTRHALEKTPITNIRHGVLLMNLLIPIDVEERKRKGYIAVFAYEGSLAEATQASVTKPVRSGEQVQKDMNLIHIILGTLVMVQVWYQ
eukprot:759142-Pelagomonas_calceolata.AAC.1